MSALDPPGLKGIVPIFVSHIEGDTTQLELAAYCGSDCLKR